MSKMSLIGQAALPGPTGIAINPVCGSVVVTCIDHAIYRIDEGGAMVLAGCPGNAGFVDGEASLARFNQPMGLAINEEGMIVVTDTNNHAVRLITPEG